MELLTLATSTSLLYYCWQFDRKRSLCRPKVGCHAPFFKREKASEQATLILIRRTLSWIFTHNMLSEAHRVWDFYILLFRCAFYCQTFEWICWHILAWWCSVNIHLNVPAQQTGHSDGHVDLMSRSLTATHPFNLMLIVTLWKQQQQLLTVASVTLDVYCGRAALLRFGDFF